MTLLPPGLRLGIGFCAASILITASLSAQGATVSFDPDVSSFELDPGQTQLVQATVCLPGHAVKADIYLLADTTTSMFPVLDQIKANAAAIVDGLLNTTGADIQVGLGSYRDFPFDAKPFNHQVSPTKSASTLVTAIETWNPAGGGDTPEGQFYALYRLATDPAIGFRPDAKRIILWFGDSPAHDPICAIFNGFGTPTFPIDEELVRTSLVAAGPFGGTAVIAVSTPTNQHFPLALNDNPTEDAKDYPFFCSVGGATGQADRIAQATGGISTSADDPPAVIAAILDSVNQLLVKSDVGCNVSGSISPFVQSITPPLYDDVVLPAIETDHVCVTFDILLKGPPCAKKGQVFHGAINVDVNGTPLASHPLDLTQPSCNPLVGPLWIGPRRIPPQKVPNGDATDVLMILPTFTKMVKLEKMPVFNIPDNAALLGLSIYAECGLFDANDFPQDPIKTSNGLKITFGAPTLGESFGAESGLHLFMQHSALLGGALGMKCVLFP